MSAVSATEVGRRVTVLRHARLMRQSDLARIAKVSRKTVCEVEAGRDASVRVMQAICAALGVKISDMLEGAPPRIPDQVNSGTR